MQTTPAKTRIAQNKTTEAIDEKVETAEIALRERVEHARDIIEDLRDRAEMAFHERPYLLPVATGVVGLGVGVLIGSKLTRVLAMTAAGALLSETVRGQVAKIGRELMKDLGDKLEGDESDADEGEPSIT